MNQTKPHQTNRAYMAVLLAVLLALLVLAGPIEIATGIGFEFLRRAFKFLILRH